MNVVNESEIDVVLVNVVKVVLVVLVVDVVVIEVRVPVRKTTSRIFDATSPAPPVNPVTATE